MEYTKEQIEEMKKKAEKWDALGAEIEKCYCNADGEYDSDTREEYIENLLNKEK